MIRLKQVFAIFCFIIWVADICVFIYYVYNAFHYKWIRHFMSDTEFYIDHIGITILLLGNIAMGIVAFKPLMRMLKPNKLADS